MAIPKPWKFTQLSPELKSFTLSGANAPHGRPRRGAVVTDGFGLRQKETYYQGNTPPDRHVFGEISDHITLTCRWMDKNLGGAGGAKKQVAYVKQFIRDAQRIRIEWGDIVTFTGLMLHIEAARESEAEIVVKLVIAIDSDDGLPPLRPPEPTTNPKDITAQMLGLETNLHGTADVPDDLPLPTSFLDTIDNAISAIGSATASLLSVANDIDEFETANASELNRLRAAIGQVRTAALTIRGALDDASCDFAVNHGSASSQTAWAQQREEDRATLIAILLLLSQMDADAEIALRGGLQKTARARSGDTWEQLSTQHYGSPDQADALRQANAARFGEKPQPGRVLHIPRAR